VAGNVVSTVKESSIGAFYYPLTFLGLEVSPFSLGIVFLFELLVLIRDWVSFFCFFEGSLSTLDFPFLSEGGRSSFVASLSMS